MHEFTVSDLTNLFNLLRRVQFNGLEEAEVAVYLSQKIKAHIDLLKNPVQEGPKE